MSIQSQSNRDFHKNINLVLNGLVKIILEHEYPQHYIVGRLTGYEDLTQTLCLEKAHDERNNKFDRIFIHGQKWISFTIEGEPFPIELLADRLRKVLPGETISITPDGKIELLGGKLMVSSANGVEGRGPTRDRVQKVFDAFIAELNEKKSA